MKRKRKGDKERERWEGREREWDFFLLYVNVEWTHIEELC